MKGVVGKFFYQYGITVTVAVFLSLLEALTLTPMRCARFMSSPKDNPNLIMRQNGRAHEPHGARLPKFLTVGARSSLVGDGRVGRVLRGVAGAVVDVAAGN